MMLDLDESWRIWSPSCGDCRHLDHDARRISGGVCRALPHGIPKPIWNGEHDHRTHYPGDNGIRFEPMTAEEQRAFDERLARSASAFEERARRVRALRAQAIQALAASRAD